MIIVRLNGGLGNQMFQYALGRKLSIKNRDVLKLDLSSYLTNPDRFFELNNLNIIENIASEREIKKVKLPYGFLSKIGQQFRLRILRKFNVGFNPAIFKKTGNIYLDGFWQSEKYFIDISNTIRQDFRLRKNLGHSAEIILKKIQSSTLPVSIHIRRGDYVYDKKTNLHHGTCDIEYYKKALETLKSKIQKVSPVDFQLFVFSDDIKWVEKNVSFPYPTIFVSDPNILSHETMFLMSKCKYNIIANSSFSWWGAWLNENQEKMVIAPAKWNRAYPKRFKDITPKSWIRI